MNDAELFDAVIAKIEQKGSVEVGKTVETGFDIPALRKAIMEVIVKRKRRKVFAKMLPPRENESVRIRFTIEENPPHYVYPTKLAA